jgi:phospholipid/cholesterol/gamma-HCH transport system permease protein
MEAASRSAGAELEVDASSVEYCDGAGAALFVALERRVVASGGRYHMTGLREEYRRLVEMITPSQTASSGAARKPPWIERLGRSFFELVATMRALIVYVGHVTVALAGVVRHPRSLRLKDTFAVAEAAGIGATPIIGLVGLLLGLILAFQSAIPMRQFGAQVFVADLLGISTIRELGALMAAILLTARSGSAFAAELGTMKVNEEIDALATMGLEPVRFLVVPRVVAAVAMVPVLTMLMSFSILVGGALVMGTLGIPLVTYVNRIAAIVGFGDLFGGLFKALFFGVVVAAVGCLRGLQTGTGAGAVGASATSAVVSGIVLIAVVDGMFAVAFYVLGI